MPQIINTNIASLTAQRNLNSSQDANSTALERLSSGLRINSAKDDAAGLAISTKFESQVKGLNVAIRNAGDGISLAQTAEGALGAMTENLQRIRELAVQSSNATNSDDDRVALQAEVDQLLSEVTRTASETNFNGRNLLDGSFQGTFQIGANAGQVVDVKIAELTAEKLGASDAVGVSAVGTDSAIGNGDLVINGVAVTPSRAGDDTASFAESDTSAIAKAAAVNRVSDETGVTAYANENIVGGSEMTPTSTSGTISVNGVAIEVQTTTDGATSRASVIEAINAASDQTGVLATDSGSNANGVILTAADGRNITVSFDSGTASAASTGLASSDTYQAGYTLVANSGVSSIEVSGGDGTGNGDLSNSGLTAGTYERGAAQLASTATSSTGGVGFELATSGGLYATGSRGIFGASGSLNTGSDIALNLTSAGVTAIFGTVAEVVTVTVGNNSATMANSSTDFGADTLAAAINSAGGDDLNVSAETRVVLEFDGGDATTGIATAGVIQIYDTNTAGTVLGAINFSSGQSVEQLAGAINASFTSIVATFNTTDGQITLTDVDGNTLAMAMSTAVTAGTVQAQVLTATGTADGALIDISDDTDVRYAYGYINDVDSNDSALDKVSISSSRDATDTTGLSGFFSRGTTAADFSSTNSLDVSVVSNTFGLEDGDLVVNGVAISAADPLTDRASAALASDGGTIQSASKERSGIAVAAAINSVAGETGVTAEVNSTVVVGSSGDTYDANVTAAEALYSSGDTGKIYINGVDLGVISLVDDGSGGIDTERSRQAAVDLINAKAGLTGVSAEDNGESITLNAADGRNISVAIDNDNNNNGIADPSATGFGALIGLDSSLDGIGEADIGTATASNVAGARGTTTEGAAYETTFSTVTLNAASQIEVSAGTRGKDELEGLGFKVGKFGGGTDGTFLKDLDISTFQGAQDAITAIDNALKTVASQRAELGALQNRFESTTANLQVTSENLAAANSRIRDADFAAETAELARTQVLQQAGISILAQANQRPQQVLSLLG
ncbi:flagellin [Saccharospirillum alexandrii]|uniref:flagellin N-terminal helical domain-containing protein n=1 Tax=Saccharospirillum alexandrii TaxID=2448477 RepID=UPI001728F5DE